jgi:hypothetical protein
LILLVGSIIPTDPSKREDEGRVSFSEFKELLREVISLTLAIF